MPTLISGSTGVNKITDGTIVDSDINASAAITGSKLVMPTGSVLQIVATQEGDVDHFTTASSYSTIISRTITCSSTSSKVYAFYTAAMQLYGNSQTASPSGKLDIFRDTTKLTSGGAGAFEAGFDSGSRYYACPVALKYLDSPSSTSELTYSVQQKVNATGRMGVLQEANLVLMEIAG